METGRVLVLDDDLGLRKSLKRLLTSRGFETAVFASGEELCSSLPLDGPACLLMDLHLGERDGFDVMKCLRDRGLEVPVVFLTAYGDVPTAVRALHAGAVDFLLKPYEPENLINAVRSACDIARKAWKREAELFNLRSRAERLSPREKQILGLVLKGYLNKEIAAELGLAQVTIKVYRSRAMRRLGARNAAELAKFAAMLQIALDMFL